MVEFPSNAAKAEPEARTATGKLRVENVELIGIKTRGLVITEKDFRKPDEFVIPKFYQPLIRSIILTPGFIADRVEKIAHDIYANFKSSQRDVVVVCLLKGASRFFSLLTTNLRQIRNDDIDLQRPAYRELYIRCMSYIDEQTTGFVKMCDCVNHTEDAIKDSDVVIVDDILETGLTIERMYRYFENKGAHSVSSCILLAKRVTTWNGFNPDWVAFDLPAAFVVGFGMDYNDRYRDLDAVCYASDAGVEAFKGLTDLG